MTRSLKTRVKNLEVASPDADHDWTIEIGAQEKDGRITNRFYKDGVEISKAQFDQEHKPKPGEPIEVILDWNEPKEKERESAKDK